MPDLNTNQTPPIPSRRRISGEDIEIPRTERPEHDPTTCGYHIDGNCFLRFGCSNRIARDCRCLFIPTCTSYIPRTEGSCHYCRHYRYESNYCESSRSYVNPSQGCVSRYEKKQAESSKRYKSKDGFEIVPLHRGFTEIIPLWKLLEETISSKKADCFICGGYARYCASPKSDPVKPGDIDIYSENKKVFNYVNNLLVRKANLKIKKENNMAITFEHPKSGKFYYMPPIQLIKPVIEGKVVAVGSKETILSNFDFTVIRAAIESPSDALVDKDFVHDETHGILRLKNIHCPVSSALRCMKYTKKGYWIRPLECMKLFADWMNREEKYRDKVMDYITKANEGEGLTQEQVDELEALMRID